MGGAHGRLRQGHDVRGAFALQPGVLHLNHGSFGAATRRALAAQARFRDAQEGRTSAYFRTQVHADLAASRAELATLFGGVARDYALVDNATAGCNTVIASLPFAEGDQVLVPETLYGAVRKALMYRAEETGLRIVEVPVPLPYPGDDAVLSAFRARLTDRTRLVICDHIASASAIRLPVGRLTALCRDAGVPVLIDGAHAPGQIALDIPAVGADFYTGNGHKWLCAPKGCGFLWVAPEVQDKIRPLIISHGYGGGFTAEFGWTGTRDASAWSCLPEVIATFRDLGGEEMMRRNRDLCRAAAETIAAALGTCAAAGPSHREAMATIRLPVTPPMEWTPDRMSIEIGDRFGIDTAIVPFGDGIGVRLSAHIYNELPDFERLLDALKRWFGL